MASPAALIGEQVGKYQVERLLGTGGMGQVYQAVHTVLGKRVAIKVLNAEYTEKKEFVTRFFNEAKAAASLNHMNIIEVVDFDQLADGRFYMLLEFLDGETLAEFARREAPIEPDLAAELLRPVCSAVGAAHDKGIIHRDLKPANIFLVKRGGTDRLVKVLDFGIAKLRDESRTVGLTRSGVVVGTPTYMSPEQALGKNELVCPASDVYSAGVIAFGLLCGRVPFSGSSGELIIKHVQEPPPPLRSVRPELPVALDRVVRKALAKAPADRWQHMPDFARAFDLALDPARAKELEALFVASEGAPQGAARTAAMSAEGAPDGAEIEISSVSSGDGGKDAGDGLHDLPGDVPTTLSRAAKLSGARVSAQLASSRVQKRRALLYGTGVFALAGAVVVSAGVVLLRGRHPAAQTSEGGAPGIRAPAPISPVAGNAPRSGAGAGSPAGSPIGAAAPSGPAVAVAGGAAAGTAPAAVTAVQIDSRPAGAWISIDGRLAGTTPMSTSLAVGRNVDLRLGLDGYETERVPLLVTPSPAPLLVTLRRRRVANEAPAARVVRSHPDVAKPPPAAGPSPVKPPANPIDDNAPAPSF